MQNIPQPLDLLVMGNEPAGLWLLREFEKIYPTRNLSKKNSKQPLRTTPQLGWLKTENELSPFFLSRPIAEAFDLPAPSFFSPEIALPKGRLKWSLDRIIQDFPAVSAQLGQNIIKNLGFLKSEDRKAIQKALSLYPELLTYAQALWKQLGRCRQMTPENMIGAALCSTELSYETSKGLVESISSLQTWELPFSSRPLVIEEVKDQESSSKLKLFQCTLPSGERILTQSLVLNLPLKQLFSLTSPSWRETLLSDLDLLSPVSHYPISLEFSQFRLPQNIAPLTLFLDEDILPEPDKEIWPMVNSKDSATQKITLWITDRTQFSLESISDHFKLALKRFHAQFPEALKQLLSQSVSLGLETCYSEEHRQNLLETIEASSRELYSHSLLQVKTRKPRVYSLLPALRCSLPYPLGPLTGAREILNDLFDKKTLQNYSKTQPSIVPTSP
jgi:hypothetical protein